MNNQYTALFQNYLRHSNEKEKAIEMLIRYLKKNPPEKLLDCGCGTGKIIEAILPYCKKIYAVDRMKRLPDELVYNPKIEFTRGNFLELKLKEKFNVILAAYLLWEIPFKKWNDTFRRFNSLLEKKGVLIVIDSYPRSEFDNPFFNFDLKIKKSDEYPDWYKYLRWGKIRYESLHFTSQITASSAEEMYGILGFFFQSGKAKDFYRLNKIKMIEDLKARQRNNQIVIDMHHIMDFVYLNG